MIIDKYDRLVRQCRTLNQVNQLHIGLDSSLLPAEAIELHDRLVASADYWDVYPPHEAVDANALRAAASSWLADLLSFQAMSGKPSAEPFSREEFLPAITIFRGVGASEKRRLLVVMCGSSPRPMMPTPSLLQALPAEDLDVALIRDFHRQGYRRGIVDVGDSLSEALTELPRVLAYGRYDHVGVMGLSGGGLPGVMHALTSSAGAVVSVGGNAPSDARWLRGDGVTGTDLLNGFIAERRKPLRIVAVFGAQSHDRPAAEELAKIAGAELLEVTDPVNGVGHNALFAMLRNGQLGTFLETKVLSPA